jgi:nucleoside-diphosphate-sugar epimerase
MASERGGNARSRVVVLGAAGGLGRATLDAALAAGCQVRALVRPGRALDAPAGVEVVRGDAGREGDLTRALTGADVAFLCVNPPFSRWLAEFPPLVEAALAAARATGVRLVFPANVWVFGRGRRGERVDEARPLAPISKRGRLRAHLEARLRAAGVPVCLVRLPEFYGPHVVSLTARVFQAVLGGRRVLWPGPLDADVELVYMPDGARALVAAGTAADADGLVVHVPGRPTTPRLFVEAVFAAAQRPAHVAGVPPWLLRVAGLFDATARGAADIAHLWTHPVRLDGARYHDRFGTPPATPYAEGIAATLRWHAAQGAGLKLQG